MKKVGKTTVLSLGGSLIAPGKIDINFLKKFRSLILDHVKKGNRVIIITGGGDTCRNYQAAAEKVNRKSEIDDLDWIGIASTKLNAELIRTLFGDLAHGQVLANPNRKVSTNKKIIIGAGYKPGHSSDVDAVLLAKAYGADNVVNLTNVSYVYDKDPKKHKNAKKLERITWESFQKIVGTKWVPGANHPFDPVATKMAKRLGLRLVVARGTDIANLKKVLSGQRFKGTVVS
ncbi:UMP kinase [bacterium]|nr:UMP kinase [bacterium]